MSSAPHEMRPTGDTAEGGKAAPQHTRPDRKLPGVRTGRVEIRLSAAERRELERRCPPEQDLSSWLRNLGLGQPMLPRSASRRRRVVNRPIGSLAQQQQSRALMSLAQSLGGLVDRMRPGAPRDQVAQLIAYVRRKWEALPC